MNPIDFISISTKAMKAYESFCQPLCKKFQLSQTSFDVLMFLANNPEFRTARDIVEVRKLKANLVSVNVDKLVCDGYLERHAVKSDRRKTELLCTEKAQPIIAKGRQLQQNFIDRILTGLDIETRQKFLEILNIMDQNLDNILKGEA